MLELQNIRIYKFVFTSHQMLTILEAKKSTDQNKLLKLLSISDHVTISAPAVID